MIHLEIPPEMFESFWGQWKQMAGSVDKPIAYQTYLVLGGISLWETPIMWATKTILDCAYCLNKT